MGNGNNDEESLLKANGLDVEAQRKEVVRKLRWRVLPLMVLLSFVSYLDRTNLAFVATAMQASLDLSDRDYSIGAGFFFLTYSLFQVPSNRVLHRAGGVKWLAFLASAWGLATCCMALVGSVPAFWAVRCVLGLFEAGFYPGTIVYLRSFFGEEDFGFAYALTLSSTCVALAFGGESERGMRAMSRRF